MTGVVIGLDVLKFFFREVKNKHRESHGLETNPRFSTLTMRGGGCKRPMFLPTYAVAAPDSLLGDSAVFIVHEFIERRAKITNQLAVSTSVPHAVEPERGDFYGSQCGSGSISF